MGYRKDNLVRGSVPSNESMKLELEYVRKMREQGVDPHKNMGNLR